MNTEGGNGNEKCCQLPFTYKKILHHHCVTDGESRPWCSLTKDYDNDGVWAYCAGKNIEVLHHTDYETTKKPSTDMVPKSYTPSEPQSNICSPSCYTHCSTVCPQSCCTSTEPLTVPLPCPRVCTESCMPDCPVKCCPEVRNFLQTGYKKYYQPQTYPSEPFPHSFPPPPPPSLSYNYSMSNTMSSSLSTMSSSFNTTSSLSR
ncbi:uncharacterized protein LOC124438681 [Xenia sp. Carnegie-2017]|uniref:uncharacterized protein LOC124438681 n=1 Tax=Xenia sp. Carnegie-2017 TaxID=2897299 RepID=UPI001F04747D|nr:uncharacterized protein LOC124438681 [Xenia sp. Carnegie-2017]